MEKEKQTTGSNRQDRRALSRRDFLANAALIGAGLAVGPLLGTASSEKSTTGTAKGSVKEKTKMKIRKPGKLEVSKWGPGAMSISANYGPPADRNQGIKSFVQPMKKASRSLIRPKYTPLYKRRACWRSARAFRDKSCYRNQFGFDLEAGGLNSRPTHIKKVVEGSLSALRPTASISITSTG